MELIEKLIEINRDKDLSQISFLNENLDEIFIGQMQFKETKDFRYFGFPLYSLMRLDLNYKQSILKIFSKYLKVEKPNTTLEFIAWVLMHVSEYNDVEELLDKILYSKNPEVQKVLFYHAVHSTIHYVQTEKFRNAIVEYVNSDFFKTDYPYMQTQSIHHAFPGQYFRAFDFGDFLPEFKLGISKSKQQKLVTEFRLNSIRLINDDLIKSDIVRKYFYRYLPTLYKTRFLDLVKKEFPSLKLEWYR